MQNTKLYEERGQSLCTSRCVCVKQGGRQGVSQFQGEVVMLSDKDKQRWGLLLPRVGVRRRRTVSASLFLLLSPCHFFNYPSLLCVPIDPEAEPASFRLRACLDSDYSLLSSHHSLPSHTHTHTHTCTPTGCAL